VITGNERKLSFRLELRSQSASLTLGTRVKTLAITARTWISLILGSLILMFSFAGYQNYQLDLLRTRGSQAMAQVMDIAKTRHPMIYGDIPAVRLQFAFRPQNGNVMHGSEEILAGFESLPGIGEQFPVLYAPDRPTQVLTPWSPPAGKEMMAYLSVAGFFGILWAAFLLFPPKWAR
jgi:hypothetical protein